MILRLLFLVWLALGVRPGNSQRYPVVGVKTGTNDVPIRKNINDLQSAGGAQWDLYIRSLIEMYKEDAKETKSYFQIAGIHGKPYVEWNGAGKRKATDTDWAGYCPHGEALFLPWHRPYIVLFEQRLIEIASQLAEQYPARYRAMYTQAAQTLRAPYWDWAASPTVPAATVPQSLEVNIPNGNSLQQVEVDNPLATYKFPQSALAGDFGTFDSQNRAQIYRCPAPQSYPDSANQLLSQRNLKQWVYDAFTYSTTFQQFASTASNGISLEQIHNVIHWDGACGSQLVDADFSAFDPLFMLHHCNIDRLWAYWQFIRPSEALFSGTYKGGARFSTPSGTTISSRNPLWPFYTADGRLHSSDTVNSIKGFGYTYLGLEYWKKSDQQLKQDATALINELYSTKVSGPQKRNEGGGDEKTRYFASVTVNVEELDRPCIVNLLMNQTNAGSLVVMKQPQTGTINGEFPLDKVSLSIEGKIDTTTGVVDTLLSRLSVEILKQDGSKIPISSVPSLKLDLVNVTVVPPEADNQLPEYRDSTKRPVEKKPPAQWARAIRNGNN